MRRLACWLGLAVGLLPLAGCAVPMDAPPDFVELRDGRQGFGCVTADDARLRVRELSEPTEGGIDFWVQTLRLDLEQQRGYEITAHGEVMDSAGVAGRWLECRAHVGGERIGYLVAVWARHCGWLIRRPYLQVVEFAARHEVFEARLPAVRAALSTVRR